jgi:PST family polysaccharide transporter
VAAQLTEKFVRSLPWAAGEALFNTLHGLLSVVVIGHFIAPAELGAASTATVTVNLVEVFSSAGLSEAVIRSKSADTIVTDTAFVLAMGLALLGTALCALAGFVTAAAFEDHRLIALTLAASLTLPLNAAAAVPSAILTRKMRAGALTRRIIGGKILGFIALSLGAASGLGPWSLVMAGLATSAGALAMMSTVVSRWPRVRFHGHEAHGLLQFGAMFGAENFLHAISIRAFSLLFGYFHGLAALGYFQLALRLSEEVGALLYNTVIRFGLSYFAGRERAHSLPMISLCLCSARGGRPQFPCCKSSRSRGSLSFSAFSLASCFAREASKKSLSPLRRLPPPFLSSLASQPRQCPPFSA